MTTCGKVRDKRTPTLLAELNSLAFMRVDSEYAKYFHGEDLFGVGVAAKFPSTARDIQEAGKALAFGLGTASVFHLVRVMEVGLRSLSKALGIPYAPSWEAHLRQIESKIATKHKQKGVKWKRDEAFFRDVSGDLLGVKIAWRNPTMHVVRHYSQQEAEDVLRAVRAFMNRLAQRLSEQGPPKKKRRREAGGQPT